MELTIKEACKQSANFMYIWADEQKFLKYIKPEFASVIRVKKANQRKLLELSADKYGKTLDDYTSAIREAFIEEWKHTPAEALIILAQGGQIAGKNWQEGVYGVGALNTQFSGNEYNGQPITVNTETGHIFCGTEDITDESKTVYNTVNKKTIPYQLFSRDLMGNIYMSQYNKLQKKYGAQSWSDDHGTYSAKTGSEITASDSADIWGTISLSIQKFLDWLLSLFGITTGNKEMITAENTLPSQTADGFVQEAGMSEAGMIVLALAAGGLLLSGGLKKKNVN